MYKDIIFSWAENANGQMVHIDSVPQGLNCDCICPHCHERLQARHGKIRAHGFAHNSENRGANLKICYMVIMYKLAEQIIQQEKKIHVPSYYGIFKERDFEFTEVVISDRFNRLDKQPDVLATTSDGNQYLIEFTYNYKVRHKEKIDYHNLNCLEIDLSSQTLETLREFLLQSNKNRKWLNNQTYFDSIEAGYSRNNKSVKIVNEEDCANCTCLNNCCGVRAKNHSCPIIVENNGHRYRICKIQEIILAEQKLHELEEYQSEIERLSIIRAENTIQMLRKQEEIELLESSNISSDLRSCFDCRSNLDWMCRNDGYAHCGSYLSMEVPKNTPPDTAKTCRGFRVKKNTSAPDNS